MNVIDRYLFAVQMFLPRAAERDVVTELAEDIRSRVEDREAALGRPLTAKEQEDLVNELGHPILLAGRYGPRRQLIGPEMFPFYWFVLRLALIVGVAVQVAVTLMMWFGGRTAQAIRQATVVLPLVAWTQFGIITLTFAALDRYGVLSRVGSTWSSRMLPEAPRRVRPLWQLSFTVLFAAWWFAALRAPFLLFGPAATVMTLAPVWQALYVPMLLLVGASVIAQLVDWLRPRAARLRALARIALYAFDIVVLVMLLRAGEYLVVTDAAGRLDGPRRAVEIINVAIPWILAFAGMTLAVCLVHELWRFVRGKVPAA
jgi:hypothetical protein